MTNAAYLENDDKVTGKLIFLTVFFFVNCDIICKVTLDKV